MVNKKENSTKEKERKKKEANNCLNIFLLNKINLTISNKLNF